MSLLAFVLTGCGATPVVTVPRQWIIPPDRSRELFLHDREMCLRYAAQEAPIRATIAHYKVAWGEISREEWMREIGGLPFISTGGQFSTPFARLLRECMEQRGYQADESEAK